MKRNDKILSIGFLVIVLFLNIGLTIGLGYNVHAHILGDNQILVHYHHSEGGHHAQGHGGANTCNIQFASYISYIDNAQAVGVKSSCILLYNEKSVLVNYFSYRSHYHTSPLRAPPFIYFAS